MEELRSLDESTKRRVLIAVVMVSMIVVVYLWLIYFNSIVASVQSPVAQSTVGAANTSSASGTGFLGLFSTAMASFWQAIKNDITGMVGMIGNARRYDIGPK